MGCCSFFKQLWRKRFRDKRIAYLELQGMIAEQASLSSAGQLLEDLETVHKEDFKVLLLHINSPGGTVGASQNLYERLIELREKHGIKIVVSMGDVCASGGVYVAMAADQVIAHRGTITGSIGVIIKSGNFRELFDKIGIRSEVVKSGEFKDILSNERALTEAERTLLQETIDNTYAQFVGAVARGRNLEEEAVRKFADGQVFTGEQAQTLGLVDQLGGKDAAIALAQKLAELPEEATPKLVKIHRKKSIIDKLFDSEMTLNLFNPAKGATQTIQNWLLSHEHLVGMPLWLMPRL